MSRRSTDRRVETVNAKIVACSVYPEATYIDAEWPPFVTINLSSENPRGGGLYCYEKAGYPDV